MTDSTARSIMVPEKSYFRPDEVAAIFRVHIRTVYNWHDEGKLQGIKLTPSCLRFSHAAIVQFLNSATRNPKNAEIRVNP